MKNRNLLLASALLMPLSAMAADEVADASENTGPWSGSAELGTIFTSGNSETQSINASLGAERDGETWDSTFRISALKTKDEDTTTAE